MSLISNKYKGICYLCDEQVEQGEGFVKLIKKKWKVYHLICEEANEYLKENKELNKYNAKGDLK